MATNERQVRVEVASNHLRRLAAGTKPLAGLSELIWNALNADAQTVRVDLEAPLGRLSTLRVSDDGHGMAIDVAERQFASLGVSDDGASGPISRLGRRLRGRTGEGRFRAFSLGERIQWLTRTKKGAAIESFIIRGATADLRTFFLTEPTRLTNQKPGTDVEVSSPTVRADELLGTSIQADLTRIFAPYLKTYPKIRLHVNGAAIDPKNTIDTETSFVFDGDAGTHPALAESCLDIVEWKGITGRELVLCDQEGAALRARPLTIHTPGFEFSAYLKSKIIGQAHNENTLDFDQSELTVLFDWAQEKIKEHFKAREKEKDFRVIDDIKAQGLYPFDASEGGFAVDIVKQAFDLCTVALTKHFPPFAKLDAASKGLQLKLLRTAVEGANSATARIISSVVKLPKTKAEEFSELLTSLSLTTVIELANKIAGRYDVLRALKDLILDPSKKYHITERNHLQPIVASNTWLFGDQYLLTKSEIYLETVLKKQLEDLGRDATILDPVRRSDGRKGRIDLMIGRPVALPPGPRRHHIIVELKDPKKKLGKKELDQIEEYAIALHASSQFDRLNTKWDFILVGLEYDDFVKAKRTAGGRPPSCTHQSDDGSLFVWAKTWAEIFQENDGRIQSFVAGIDEHSLPAATRDLLTTLHQKYVKPID